jgi:TPR repeat protein
MLRLAAMSNAAEARDLLQRAAEGGHVEAMRLYASALVETDTEEALAWLYASVGMSGDAPTAHHGASLARELSADEIVAAQKRGRAILKHFRKEQRRK